MFCLGFALVLLVLFAGCFSPWTGDEATLSISLGGDPAGRVLITSGEQYTFAYEVLLDGPRGMQRETFPPGQTTASFRVFPGEYRVTVRGIGDRPSSAYSMFPPKTLRAWGVNMVDIKPGKTASASIEMYSAVEAENATQLGRAISQINTLGKAEIIVVKGTIKYTGQINIIGSPFPPNIILAAEEPAILDVSASPASNAPITINGGKLTLGMPGMGGTLTIDGKNANCNYSLIEIGSGSLVMNDRVILQNRGNATNSTDTGGGVKVGGGGTFAMNGGIIRDNYAFDSSNDAFGGGVFVDSGCKFTMYGGIISNNNASSGSFDAFGGGVCVDIGGSFTMYGGLIAGNTGTGSNGLHGGGVGVVNTGTFTMVNGVIRGNWCEEGGGVYAGGGGTFTMNGGIIEENRTDSAGGGVLVEYLSSFTMNGGIIRNNIADINNSGSDLGGGLCWYSGASLTGWGVVFYGNKPDDIYP